MLRSRSLWDYEIPSARREPTSTMSCIITRARARRPDALPAAAARRAAGAARRPHARRAVALDDAEVRAAVWRFAAALTPLLLLLGALLTAAAWVQVAVGLRPLAAMRAKLAAIGSGERPRLGTGFPDEVRPLAQRSTRCSMPATRRSRGRGPGRRPRARPQDAAAGSRRRRGAAQGARCRCTRRQDRGTDCIHAPARGAAPGARTHGSRGRRCDSRRARRRRARRAGRRAYA